MAMYLKSFTTHHILSNNIWRCSTIFSKKLSSYNRKYYSLNDGFLSSRHLLSTSALCLQSFRNQWHLNCQKNIFSGSNIPRVPNAKEIVQRVPKEYRPYLKLMRFDKPIGSWLLFLPCCWSITMASVPGHLPSFTTLALFGAGAILMRGAACTINDLWDRDIDKKVKRTQMRPLACGELKIMDATNFLFGQLGASFLILLTFNLYTIGLGIMSLVPVALYPLAKRYTWWPQLVLGATINWGVLMGFSAIKGYCLWSAVLPLYFASISWTLIYDTIYAHQDKGDDMHIGVKSLALKLGDQTKPWLKGFAVSMMANLLVAGVVTGQTLPYYAGLGMVAGHLKWQITDVDLNNSEDCWKKFISNKNLGLIIFGALVASNLFRN